MSAAVYTFLSHSASSLPDFLFINNLLHHSVSGKSHGHFSFVMQHPPNPLTSHRSAYAIFPLPSPPILTLFTHFSCQRCVCQCRKKVCNFGTVPDFYELICSGMHSPLHSQELNSKILLQNQVKTLHNKSTDVPTLCAGSTYK